MLTWFKNEFGYQEVLEAEARGIAAEEILDRYLAETEPGAMGLVVQPHWGGALDAPFAKGAMIGFGEIHTKAHIYRGLIEGLGFALRDAKENMERAGGLEIREVGVSGGGSQSEEICRIAANIFNLPLAKGKTHEASGLGAAIITATGVGMFSSLEDATESMAKTDRVFTPDPQAAEMYRKYVRKGLPEDDLRAPRTPARRDKRHYGIPGIACEETHEPVRQEICPCNRPRHFGCEDLHRIHRRVGDRFRI